MFIISKYISKQSLRPGSPPLCMAGLCPLPPPGCSCVASGEFPHIVVLCEHLDHVTLLWHANVVPHNPIPHHHTNHIL